MHKLIFSACLLYSLALASQPADTIHVFPSHTGLVLIGATSDGFAIAADGAQSNADGTASEIQKLYQVGKYGAIAFPGSVSIQDPMNRPVREEVNISRIAKAWLDAHPDAGLETANREINSLISQVVAKFFSTRDPGPQAGKFAFAIICIGFVDSKPMMAGNKYFMPVSRGKSPRVEKAPGTTKPGEVWIFGDGKIPEELMKGKLNALKKFKAEPSVNRFRSSRTQDLTAQDFAGLFDTILQAAESDEGKRFDHNSSIVAPPNRLATISVKNAFAWSK
jgi:hypothetical protein